MVGDRKLQPVAVAARRTLAHLDQQLTRRDARVVHGLHAVAGQVQQHLLHHRAVAVQRGQVRAHHGAHRHPQLAGLQDHQRHDGVQQGLGAHLFTRLVPAADKVVHTFDDPARAFGLLGNTAHRRLQHLVRLGQAHGSCRTCRTRHNGRLPIAQQVHRPGCVAGDGGQRLVQLVAQQGGHLTHSGQACSGLQTLLAGP